MFYVTVIFKHFFHFCFILFSGLGDLVFQDPEDLYRFVEKDNSGMKGAFFCTMCGKKQPTRRDVRNHVESIHFPDMFTYNCDYCHKQFKTKKSKDWHLTSSHKDRSRNAFPGPLSDSTLIP